MFSLFIALFRLPMKFFLFFSFLVHALFFPVSFFFSHCSWTKRRIAWIGKKTDIGKKRVIFSSFSQFMRFFFSIVHCTELFSVCVLFGFFPPMVLHCTVLFSVGVLFAHRENDCPFHYTIFNCYIIWPLKF